MEVVSITLQSKDALPLCKIKKHNKCYRNVRHCYENFYLYLNLFRLVLLVYHSTGRKLLL